MGVGKAGGGGRDRENEMIRYREDSVAKGAVDVTELLRGREVVR